MYALNPKRTFHPASNQSLLPFLSLAFNASPQSIPMTQAMRFLPSSVLVLALGVFLSSVIAPPAFARCVYGSCENGTGEYRQDNRVYIGEFKNGKPSGRGVEITRKGRWEKLIYIGDWVEGKREGTGIIFDKKEDGQYLAYAKMHRDAIQDGSYVIMRSAGGAEAVYKARTDYISKQTSVEIDEDMTEKFQCLFGNNVSELLCVERLKAYGVDLIMETTMFDLITSRGVGGIIKKRMKRARKDAAQEVVFDLDKIIDVGNTASASKSLLREMEEFCRAEIRICPK